MARFTTGDPDFLLKDDFFGEGDFARWHSLLFLKKSEMWPPMPLTAWRRLSARAEQLLVVSALGPGGRYSTKELVPLRPWVLCGRWLILMLG